MTVSALSSQVGAILNGLGIASATEYDVAYEVVATELDRIQVAAAFESLRHGELTLVASPQEAALLRYNLDVFQSRLEERLPGLVQKVTVFPRRFPSELRGATDGSGVCH
jgi:hypothetical protein